MHVKQRAVGKFEYSKVRSSTLAKFRHNRIVQSPHENYFNVRRQLKERSREHDDLCFLKEKPCQSVDQAAKLSELHNQIRGV